MAGWVAGGLAGWVGWLGWLAGGWLAGWLVGWLTGWVWSIDFDIYIYAEIHNYGNVCY